MTLPLPGTLPDELPRVEMISLPRVQLLTHQSPLVLMGQAAIVVRSCLSLPDLMILVVRRVHILGLLLTNRLERQLAIPPSSLQRFQRSHTHHPLLPLSLGRTRPVPTTAL